MIPTDFYIMCNFTRRALGICLIGLFLAPIRTVAQTNIDLIILAGQSNAVGQGAITPPASALGASVPDRLVFVPSSGLVEPLTLLNNMGEQHGIELSLMDRMHYYIGPVALVKLAVNGSSMLDPNPVGPFGVWDVDAGTLYNQLVLRTLAARSALELLGYSVTIRALVWWQGESDAITGGIGTATYFENTLQFFTDLRTDLSEPDLPIFMLRIGNNIGSAISQFGEVQVIRALQDQLGTQPRIVTLDMDQWYIGDIHTPSPSLIAIGYQVADAIQNYPLAFKETPTQKPKGPYKVFDISGRSCQPVKAGVYLLRGEGWAVPTWYNPAEQRLPLITGE